MAFNPALLTAIDSTSHVHLIIGSNPLAGARCGRSIEVGARPILIAPPIAPMHYGLSKRIEDGEVEWVKREFQDEDLKTLGREQVDRVVDAVFVTLGPRNPASTHISNLCRRLRIPVNVAEAAHLCTFTLLSTHNDGPLQIGVTTSGKGCKLSSRIRREITSSLPPNLGTAVSKLGTLRRRIWEEDYKEEAQELEAEDDDSGQSATFNKLVTLEDLEAIKTRRMRWLSQICEYWPLNRLASISDADVDVLLNNYTSSILSSSNLSTSRTTSTLPASLIPALPPRKPYITLAGSGPGSPHLLTLATLSALRTHPVILTDKLVPAAVLSLIPRRTTVHIARKFPGSAEAAQDELLSLAEEGLKSGKHVLRLKQGDPYLFGRGGEEAKWFEERGWEVRVLPGITSALSAPLCAGVPVTQRGVADGVLLVTGTGRKGKAPAPPTYMPTTTVVFLMGLHRLESLVASLIAPAGRKVGENEGETQLESDKRGLPPGWTAWPRETPICIVERASCPDQRIVRSSLQHVVAAMEELGSRPPGLIVMGNACEVLRAPGGRWSVEEGVGGLCGGGMEGDGLEGLLGMVDGLGLKEGVVQDPTES